MIQPNICLAEDIVLKLGIQSISCSHKHITNNRDQNLSVFSENGFAVAAFHNLNKNIKPSRLV